MNENVTKEEFSKFQAEILERYNQAFSSLAQLSASHATQQGALQMSEIVLAECVAIWATDPGARQVLLSVVAQAEKELRAAQVNQAFLEGATRLLNRVRDSLQPQL